MNYPGNKMGAVKGKFNWIPTLDSHTKRNYKQFNHFNVKQANKKKAGGTAPEVIVLCPWPGSRGFKSGSPEGQ